MTKSYTKSIFPAYTKVVQASTRRKERCLMAQKANGLFHIKWRCKYHIVFTPKYRRKIIYGQYKESIRDILRQLCAYKGVEILEGHLMPDHVHMMVSIPPKISVSQFMGYLKGKSALMIVCMRFISPARFSRRRSGRGELRYRQSPRRCSRCGRGVRSLPRGRRGMFRCRCRG